MTPVTMLVCALGGEGGGVLSEWIVDAARIAGMPAQASSIPGVAQRTGATTYYLELLPLPLADLQGRRPVFSLQPVPGELDLLVSSELLETARQIGLGHADARRTQVISSLHRSYTTLERMQPGDGRRDAGDLRQLVQAFSQDLRCFDMQALAEQAGTLVSAVMLGAIAGSGRLPLRREHFEAAIGAGGHAAASLRGFALGFAAMVPSVGAAAQPAVSADPAVGAPQPHTPLPPAAQAALADLAPAARELVQLGYTRVCEYQDPAYGQRYLDRVQVVFRLDRDPAHALTAAHARWLALWMAFDDVVRVAELKSRASRWERLRQESGAREGELLRVHDHFRPGVAELAGLLPPAWARRLTQWDQRRQQAGATPLSVPLKVGRHTVRGMLALRLLASLKWLRARGSRFADEQAQIDRWSAAIVAAAGRSQRLALEVARCGQLIKGYGSTRERGRDNLAHLVEHLAGQPDAEAAADALAAARVAALRDEAGRELDASLRAHGAPARPVKAQPIRWVRRAPGDRLPKGH